MLGSPCAAVLAWREGGREGAGLAPPRLLRRRTFTLCAVVFAWGEGKREGAGLAPPRTIPNVVFRVVRSPKGQPCDVFYEARSPPASTRGRRPWCFTKPKRLQQVPRPMERSLSCGPQPHGATVRRVLRGISASSKPQVGVLRGATTRPCWWNRFTVSARLPMRGSTRMAGRGGARGRVWRPLAWRWRAQGCDYTAVLVESFTP